MANKNANENIDKIIDWFESKNLIKLLGNLKRSNVNFSRYEDNPELFDALGEKGVKFRDTPGWFNTRPYTVGNTVFFPKTSKWKSSYDNFSGTQYSSLGERIAKEEVPHVAQYREKGILRFLSTYLNEMSSLGGQAPMYDTKESLEGFHHESPEEKQSLFKDILGK